MSKSNIRKITVDPTKCNTDPRRPSVFERLGTKPATTTGQNTSDYCRNWALNGSCSYGKNCKYANTHTLISPSKRVKKDNASANVATLNEDPLKRLTSKIVKKTSHSPDLNLEEWNQTDLEYEDEKVLERRRQLLQRELELQMKKDKEVHGKDKTKHKKKAMSSSSSSRSSSTSSSSSCSSSDDSSSSSTSDSRKKVKKVKSKRHHSTSSDYDEDKERKKKLKLKRLSGKPEKLIAKKKRKIEVPSKKDTISKTSSKKITLPVSRKHTSTVRAKSPPPPPSHTSSSKAKERNRSESPKSKVREFEKEKHYKKVRDADETSSKDIAKGKTSEKVKELEKGKSRAIEERSKGDDRSKQRPKEKERRSRTPPLDRSKHQHTKESTTLKSKRSRTPEKSTRSKRDPTPPRHQDKPSVSSRSREVDKKDRDPYKKERSKDRDDSRRNDQSKSRLSSNQDDNHRKNAGRDFDDKNYASDRSRQRSKERRDKDHSVRDERSHSRVSRDQRDSLREKEREEAQERCRERQRERDRDKDSSKVRERDIPPLMATAAINPMEKSSRYGRDKERFKDGGLDKTGIRDRRSDRERERTETKPVERERGSQRFDSRYDRPAVEKEVSTHKSVDRDRAERFPRERSLDRIVDKNVPPPPREHLLEREAFERDRQRRFNARFDRTHASEHERKDQPHIPPLKIDRLSDRRDSPRLSIEMDRNFERGYARLPPPEHWEEQEEPAPHLDYRDHHTHDENRRKPVEPRRYNSPFEERRGRDDRPQSRYAVQNERQFDELHHPLYAGEKLRTGAIRDESSNENWDLHHELEHGNRDRAAYAQTDWEEREWRARHAMWERESLPRSEAHDEEWAPRYESPMPDWKHNEARKWDNQPLHVRGPFRNDRVKDLDVADALHNKRRPFNTPELREECSTHGSKQGSLHGSMKEEPINKKLMELAEGRPRRSREKSADSFQKRMLPREKSEAKEPPAPEPKRPCLDESLQTLHTESDLSDISDDPDDILNMEEEIAEANKSQSPKKTPETTEKDSQPVQNHDAPQPSLSDAVEEKTFTKEKETTESMEFRNLEDENMETMDFEEISDGELEEDIKTSGKGLGDALGVDWESLVKESQPRRSISNQDTAQGRWQCKAIFQRIGMSVKYAGPELLQKLTKKYGGDDSDSEKLLLDDIALIHTALVRKKFIEGLTKDSLINDDLLYRYNNEEDEDEDVELLEPCTSLYEEAKLLLQQAA